MRALIPGVPILFQWVPRKVNGKADRLTHNARVAHKSNIDLPEAVLNSLLVPYSRVGRQTVPLNRLLLGENRLAGMIGMIRLVGVIGIGTIVCDMNMYSAPNLQLPLRGA